MLAFLFAAATALAANTVQLPKTAVCQPKGLFVTCTTAPAAYTTGELVGVTLIYSGGKLYMPQGTKCSQQSPGTVCVMPTPKVMPRASNRPE